MTITQPAGDTEQRRFAIFLAYAEEMADLLEGKQSTIAPVFRSPVVVLGALRDEIGAARFRNRNLIAFMRDEITSFLCGDTSLRSDADLMFYFTLLRDCLKTAYSDKTPVVTARFEEIVSTTMGIIREGRYAFAALRRVQDLVTNLNADFDQGALRDAVRNLAFAFITLDYSPDGFRRAIHVISDTYSRFPGDDTVFTTYPIRTSRREFLTGLRFDTRAFNDAIQAELDNLALPDRFGALRDYITASPKQYTVIFRIEHVVGSADLRFGDVQLYQAIAGQPRFISCDHAPGRDAESFFEPGGVNAAVPVAAMDMRAAEAIGRRQVLTALDVLRAGKEAQVPLRIDRRHLVIAEPYGHVRTTHTQTDPEKSPALARVYSASIDGLDQWHLQHFANISAHLGWTFEWRPIAVGDARPVSSRVVTADPARVLAVLRHYRRAIDAEQPEDRLLSGWIGLEALMGGARDLPILSSGDSGIEARVRSLIPALSANRYRWDVAMRLRDRIGAVLSHQLFNQTNDRLDMPQDLRERALFVPSTERSLVNISDFVRLLPEILSHTIDPLLHFEIDNGIRFYSDARYALREVQYLEDRTRDELTMIYQLRNRIVHQAATLQTVSYYAGRAFYYLNSTLSAILAEPTESAIAPLHASAPMITDDTLLRIPVQAYVFVERLKERLKDGGVSALLET